MNSARINLMKLSRESLWIDLAKILQLGQNFKILGQILEGLFSFGQIFEPTLAK